MTTTDPQQAIVDAVSAFVVGPNDHLVVSLPDADMETLQHVRDLFAERGFDMDRVLILAGAVQIGVIREGEASA